jgi:predicted RNase H-like HicB family nuclease
MIDATLTLQIEIDQEDDGRWIAEITDLPGVMSYGLTSDEAKAKVQALALRVLADRLEHGEAGPEPLQIRFQAA